ncbi:MAG TPA: type II secretion system F family protein [Candidatus Bathyarchaeia archaeon]|nr:type II secretion system F family protein [Candidatus Bathyarchaeia archaeon]
MLKFNYYVKDKQGNPKKGIVEAIGQTQAAQILRERGLIVISLQTRTEGIISFFKRKFLSRVGLNEVVNFTRQLSTMINAGLVITDALTILRTQTENLNMASIIDSIQKDIEGGSSFSKALEKNPAIFDPVYVALVRAGETAGVLDKILNRLADNLEKRREFVNKIKSAMVYPIIIVGGMVVVGAIMMIFVIPKLLDLYQEFEANLPLATIILMSLSNFLSKFWWLVIIVILAVVWLIKAVAKTEAGKLKIDAFFFSLPVVGRMRKAMMLTEFTRTLGLLIGSGVLVVDALNVSLGAMTSALYRKSISDASSDVEKGTALAVSLARTEVFPPLLPQMISVGEETGKLDEVLLKIAGYFEGETEMAISGLTTAIEPLVMIILGLGVGFLIVAVIMPIYNLTSQF